MSWGVIEVGAAAVSHLMWVLGIDPGSSGRAARALSCQAISSAPGGNVKDDSHALLVGPWFLTPERHRKQILVSKEKTKKGIKHT